MDRSALAAIVQATREDGVHTETGAYLDWSSGVDDQGRLEIEVGPDAATDAEVLTLRLTPAEAEALVHRLAVRLMSL